MKRLILAVPLMVSLFIACSSDFGVGPEEPGRGLETSEGPCNPNAQLC